MASRSWKRGTSTSYGYNGQGDLNAIDHSDTAANPDVSFSNFDRQGRATTVTEARNGGSDVTTLSYHPVTGEVTTSYGTHSLLSSLSVTMKAPDSSGRAKGYDLSNGTSLQSVTYGYDGYSRLGSVASGDLTVGYTYYDGTAIPKVVTHTLASSVVPRIETRHVDLAGRTTGVVTTVPSGGGRTIAASAGYKYNSRGLREKLTREDGTSWTYGYNDRSEVISGVKKLANGTLAAGQQFGYDYDGIGNRLWAKSGGDSSGNNLRTVTYTPDALNQYDAVATPGSFDVLVRSADTVGVTVNGTAATMTRQGNLHRALANVTNTTTGAWAALSITSPAGTGTPSTGNRWVPKATTVPVYDADGNLTNDGRWEYVWDGENRLVSMTTLASGLPSGMPRKKLEFAYDWMSRRIAKKVSNWSGSSWTATDERRFTYDGWNLVGEFKMVSGTRTLEKTYLWGTDLSGTPQGAGGVGGLLVVNTIHPSSSTCYPAYDGKGNIIAWIAPNGDTLQRLDYDPFGNVTARELTVSFSAPSFGFSTKYQDPESGFCYYGYRYYDPGNGRWQSLDPIEESGGINLFGFLQNNGLSLYDVLGLQRQDNVESYKSWIFAGHGWHQPGTRLENLMSEYQKSGKGHDRVTAVSCFNGNINDRFPRSVRALEYEQWNSETTPDIVYHPTKNLGPARPNQWWNIYEPGFMWVTDPVTGINEAYPAIEAMIQAAEEKAKSDCETVGESCRITVEVICPSYVDVSSIDFRSIPVPPGKSVPCGYKNQYSCKLKKWSKNQFNR